ncbi:MAG: hypothetical protein H6704_14065 [Myxococcales bacterium]|nr:hypothetical protein [Myxococcales bacterium]
MQTHAHRLFVVRLGLAALSLALVACETLDDTVSPADALPTDGAPPPDATPDARAPSDGGPDIGPPVDAGADAGASACAVAQQAAEAACCAGDEDHPGGGDPSVGTASVVDCDTGERTDVPCMETSGLPPLGGVLEAPAQTFDGPDETDPACTAAAEAAALACADPSLADAIDCGVADEVADVLPACDVLRAWSDAEACAPFDLTRWRAFDPGARAALFEALAVPPDVEADAPPDLSTWDDGAPVPPPAEVLHGEGVDASERLDVVRLQLPGNFLRYQLAHAVLRSAIAQADVQQGFACDADALRCTVNPLRVFDLGASLSQDGAFHVEAVTIGDDATGGWRIQNLRWSPDLDDWAELTVRWDGYVDLTPEALAGVDFGAPTRLSLLPAHLPLDGRGPDGGNSYALPGLDAQARARHWLDRTILVAPLDSATCTALSQAPNYVTFRQPTRCICPFDGSDGYCVVDPAPRADMPLAMRQVLQQSDAAHLVYCTDPPTVEVGPLRGHEAAFDLDNGTVQSPLTQLLAMMQLGVSDATVADDLVRFGCAGRLVERVRLGPTLEEDFGPYTLLLGRSAASQAGLELSTAVELGGVRVAIISGLVHFDFDFGVRFEEWVKRKFGKVIGWVLRWVLKVISGIISISVTVELPPPGILNTAFVKLDAIELDVQAVVSQRAPPGGVGVAVEVGARRVTTSPPRLDPGDGWGFDVTFGAPSCKAFTGSGSLIDRLKRITSCPVEAALSAAGVVTAPLQRFLAEQVLEITLNVTEQVNDALVDTAIAAFDRLEDSNVVARVFQTAAHTLVLDPSWTWAAGDAGEAMTGTLPPALAHACALAPDPEIACTLAHLLMGHGYGQASVRATLLRVGAMTHGRSRQDFDPPVTAEAFAFPPVRYCVLGDRPPGAPAFDADDRAFTQDMLEVDVDDEAAAAPLDWRTQCALFVDLSPWAGGTIATPTVTYAVGVWVSRRTEALLNDVFTCRNSAECHPEGPQIRARAALAACSLVGDVWAGPAQPGADYLNLLRLLSDVDVDPALIAGAEAIWTRAVGAQGFGVSPASFLRLRDAARGCRDDLAAAGFAPPPRSLPAAAFFDP